MRRLIIVLALALVVTSRIAPVSAAGKAMAQAAVRRAGGHGVKFHRPSLAGVVVNLRDLAGQPGRNDHDERCGLFHLPALNPRYDMNSATQARQHHRLRRGGDYLSPAQH